MKVTLNTNKWTALGCGVVTVLSDNSTECLIFVDENFRVIGSGYGVPFVIDCLSTVYAKSTVFDTDVCVDSSCTGSVAVGSKVDVVPVSQSDDFERLFSNVQGGDYYRGVLRNRDEYVTGTFLDDVTDVRFDYTDMGSPVLFEIGDDLSDGILILKFLNGSASVTLWSDNANNGNVIIPSVAVGSDKMLSVSFGGGSLVVSDGSQTFVNLPIPYDRVTKVKSYTANLNLLKA